MKDENDEWTAAERTALNALPRELPPIEGLEERVVAELRRRRLLSGSEAPHRTLPWQLRVGGAIAAAALLFVVGLEAGRWPRSGSRVDPGSPRFLLLLHEDAKFDHPVGHDASLARVTEYGRWVRELRAGGRLVAGEELEESGWVLPTQGSPPSAAMTGDRVGGFFVIAAENTKQALAIARTCPHLRHGGRVEVRKIRPT